VRLGILVSGRGSNMAALLDAARAGELGGAAPTVVIANVADAPAIGRALAAGVEAIVVAHASYAERDAFEAALVEALRARGVELVALAGFMRLLSPRFVEAFRGKIINVHPSLLPAFPGLHAQRQALDYGAKVSGCTVHFVDEGTDTGPIIAQAAVPILDGDDEESLSARILQSEHRLYPAAIRALAEGRVARDGRRVTVR
jgi:phosphoribosylglycinamide formyltransferase-1